MTKNNDCLARRMKKYEAVESERRFMPLLPIVARLDGHNFHAFTKGMKRPVDQLFRTAMIETTEYLVRETHARIGYTQSDEITLIWEGPDLTQDAWYDGRVLKTCTHLAAMASVFFNSRIQALMPAFADRHPRFDARAHNVPTREEAANNLLWREEDATCNSLKMLAQAHYPHSELFGKSEKQMHDMLHTKNVNWDSYPVYFKRGIYVRRVEHMYPFHAEDLAKLPPKHKAHTEAGLMVTRSVIEGVVLPIFSKITNQVDVVFNNAAPIVASSKANTK